MKANIRVYGWLENENKEVLLLREKFMGEQVIKFPGGGLEEGEGLANAVVREFYEELNLSVRVVKHLYTQDFYQPTRLPERGQLLVVFYEVATHNLNKLRLKDVDEGELVWTPISQLGTTLQLPIDRAMLNHIFGK